LIELRSREKPYMPSVAWFYPEDRPNRSKVLPPTPIIPELDQRRYRYAIEGDKTNRWVKRTFVVLAFHVDLPGQLLTMIYTTTSVGSLSDMLISG
jgi:hypothetical protein